MEDTAYQLNGLDEFPSPNIGQDRKDQSGPHHERRMPSLGDVIGKVQAHETLNLATGEIWAESCGGEPSEDSHPAYIESADFKAFPD